MLVPRILPALGWLFGEFGIYFFGVCDGEIMIQLLWRPVESDFAFVKDENGIVKFKVS